MKQSAPYRVSRVTGSPSFDSVPVAKIIDYPLEKRDYRPFAQCILCVSEDRLYLRMWAFEVSPVAGSALRCVFYPYPDAPERGVDVCFEHGPDEHIAVSLFPIESGEDRQIEDAGLRRALSADFKCHPHNGEDLQGVYWGMTISVSLELIERLGGKTALIPGSDFPGNFFKLCADEKYAHMGSLFPADFPARPFEPHSMGTFSVVAY